MPVLSICYALVGALASVINDDHKWYPNLEHHLLTTLEVSFTALRSFPKRTNPECKNPNLFRGIYVIIPNVNNPEHKNPEILA